MKYYIDSNAWKQILTFLRQIKAIHTRDERSLRRFVEAIWFIVRSGSQWRLLPEYYGYWRAVHRRFKRWVDLGIWEQLMEYVTDKDLELSIIDATIVRAHACSAGYGKDTQERQALGRSKGGFTTKIHALVGNASSLCFRVIRDIVCYFKGNRDGINRSNMLLM